MPSSFAASTSKAHMSGAFPDAINSAAAEEIEAMVMLFDDQKSGKKVLGSFGSMIAANRPPMLFGIANDASDQTAIVIVLEKGLLFENIALITVAAVPLTYDTSFINSILWTGNQ